MANYTSKANVILTVNGKQAQKMLSQLEKDASRLEKQISKAASAGDKASMKKLQSELKSTQRMMDQLKGSSASVENTLRCLDKATPKELNKTLKTLKQQLSGIERGTEAWDAHVEKIKAVKEEIRQLNEEMNPDEGFWDKLNGYWEKFQLGITAAAADVTGLVMAGRKAVDAYAEMEQEMANVQKFTGMDPEEVTKLNEEFKKIDTRTSREELNQLAQEAGRLGKTSIDDVLGFVRAADKINVALDDLGDGATLTLSKLTGIFGDEDRLGTEKALLSVGSVINELSQNCSASAPYIAEFASRMGGVGAQAGLTVQQIMGFAAVLDSNNQALEASATALSQVIVRIYQDPAKYARVAGMDVQNFSNLVKTDMNAALIEFLTTLKQAGGMDVLSPMFKDMGENGSRAISALSTLANNIEDVKNQQIVANEAFEDATSIDQEFEVQNNTVQAGLDKAKTRVHELAVELGEKLQPVMRLVISSSTVALKVLSAIVSFLIENSKAVLTFCVALASYYTAVNIATIKTVVLTTATKAWHVLCKVLPASMALLRVAFAALVNSVQYFTNALQVNYAMQLRWRKAVNMMAGAGGAKIFALIAAAAVALTLAISKLISNYNHAAKALGTLNQVREQAAIKVEQEKIKIEQLITAASDLNTEEKKRIDICNQLNSIVPKMNAHIDSQTKAFVYSKAALQDYINALTTLYELEGAKEKFKELGKQRAELTIEKNKLEEQKRQNLQQSAYYNNNASGNFNYSTTQGGGVPSVVNTNLWNSGVNKAIEMKINNVNDKLAQNKADINILVNTYGIDKLTKSTQPQMPQGFTPSYDKNFSSGGSGYTGSISSGSGSDGSGTSSSGNSANVGDKFAAERDWREKEEALTRICYARGESDYLDHTWRMNEIAVEFCAKQLQHTDLTEQERLTIQADYFEAKKKQRERFDTDTVEAENYRYNEELANLKQFYIDGSISKETYDVKAEEAEILHQKHLSVLYRKGSQERLQAEQQLQSILFEQRERKVQEAEKLEKQYAEMKKEYFGDNPKEAQAKFDADLALLKVVYEREIAAAGENAEEKLRIEEAFEKAKLALKKKYGLLAEEDTRNAMEKGIVGSVEWLESDGGKALTGTLSTLTSGMSSIFSQLSSSIQADLEMQTAEINKRYDAEISRAEGNSYLVKKIEQEKQNEIAKAKNEANRKLFAMQVIQAVAQTATNALNAYGSAAAVPVVGYILAPIAAAMAVAAGAIQIANIKKQQQASEAQGYQSGGFTPKGKPDQEVGVVHAGEWVASQALVNNPQTRPLLEALDYAQRTNTIGSIRMADVSRTITAPAMLAAQGHAAPTIVNNTYTAQSNSVASERVVAVLDRLDSRLNEPFITINTVTGDHGIKQAEAKFDRLIKNKSPKSRK